MLMPTTRVSSRERSPIGTPNTLNRPQYRVGDTDISVVNGTPYWAAPLAPDGLFNTITKRQAGTVLVDMTTQQANIRSVDGELGSGLERFSIGTTGGNSSNRRRISLTTAIPKMVIHSETQYIAVPYSEPQFHLTPLPHHASVGRRRCHRSSGSIETLSPSRLLPVRFSTISSCILSNWRSSRSQRQKYRNGILNTYTSHEDGSRLHRFPETETISRSLSSLSRVRSTSSPSEPYGDAQGLKELWTIDAKAAPSNGTCQLRLAVRPTASSGPREAISATDRLGPLFAAEPILTVIDDREYWQVRVVPGTTAGLRMSHLSTHGPVMLIHSNRQTQSLSSSQVRLG